MLAGFRTFILGTANIDEQLPHIKGADEILGPTDHFAIGQLLAHEVYRVSFL